MPMPPVIFILNGLNLNALGSPEPRIIEVHLSNVYAREHFRRQGYDAQVERCSIVELSPMGYPLALDAAAQLCKGASKSAAQIQ